METNYDIDYNRWTSSLLQDFKNNLLTVVPIGNSVVNNLSALIKNFYQKLIEICNQQDRKHLLAMFVFTFLKAIGGKITAFIIIKYFK